MHKKLKKCKSDIAFGIEDMVEEESEIGNDESKLCLFSCLFSYHRKCGKEILPSQEDKGAGTRLKRLDY